MFAYCRNTPVRRVDIAGTADVDCYDDAPLDEEDVLKTSQGGGSSQYTSFSGDSTITLYRSVGVNEALDIKQTGRFNLSPKGMESKQFGLSYEETSVFGKFVGQSTIVSVKIPKEALSYFDNTPVDKMIFKQGTITVYGELLDLFNEIIIGMIDFQ